MDWTAAQILLAVLCFVPPVAYILWLRNQEKHLREPVRAVLGAFVYGASAAVALVLVSFQGIRGGLGLLGITVTGSIIVILIAPLLEELFKASGLPLFGREMDEPEDGIIYGTALGLGFGATENLVFAGSALSGTGTTEALATVAVRTISSLLLHAGAAALVGFGYGWVRLHGRSLLHVLPYYLVAVALHAGFNLVIELSQWWGLAADVVLVAFLATAFRFRIRQLDAVSAPSVPGPPTL